MLDYHKPKELKMNKVTNNIVILPLIEKHIDEIMQIENSLKNHIYSKNNLLDALNNKNYNILVAKKDNEIIGYISVCFVKNSNIDIESIVVKENYRKNGVATSLLNNIFIFAKSINVKDIFLEVRASNTPAINLYLKNRFKKISIRKKYYTDNLEDAIILKKEL